MGKIRMKLCGITRVEDYMLTCSLGIDFAGFVFVPSSPRCVTAEEVLEITREEPGDHPVKIGVFADQSPDEILKICSSSGLGIAQLHGSETPGFCKSLGIPFWKVITDPARVCEYGDPLLLDASGVHRNGACLNLECASKAMSSGRKIILAGGISTVNVHDFISLNPWGVDFSSSVESSPGVKESTKVKEIAEIVRRYGNDNR